jgi:hypothetical protein
MRLAVLRDQIVLFFFHARHSYIEVIWTKQNLPDTVYS